MWLFDLFRKKQKDNKHSELNRPIKPEAANHTVVEESQAADPVKSKAADSPHELHGSAAVNDIQTNIFILHTANDDKELNLFQSELSGLIEREYGCKIYPYMYDEEISDYFSNFDSDTVHYYFSLNGFEFELNFYFNSNNIMLISQGRADDPFGNEFAGLLKQHIHKVLAQRAASEEKQTAIEDDIGNPSLETGGNDSNSATMGSAIEEEQLLTADTIDSGNEKNSPDIGMQEKQSEIPATIRRKACYCHCCWDKISEEEAQTYNKRCKLCAVPPDIKHDQSIPVGRFKMLFQESGKKLSPGLGAVYYFGLDKENGNAWMVDKRPVGEEYYGKLISYEYLITCSDEAPRSKNIKDLNRENWYEFLLLSVGDRIPLGRGESHSGPYGSSEHYYLKVLENGYLIEWRFGAPMAGMYDNRWELPNGFFADKSKEQIVAYFKGHSGYIPKDCVGICEEDLEALVQTDCWRMNRCQ